MCLACRFPGGVEIILGRAVDYGTEQAMGRQRWVYHREPSPFPEDFPERLERFRVAAGLSSRGLARRLRVDARTMRRWRSGIKPDPGHLVALFAMAEEMGLLHLLLHGAGDSGTCPNDYTALLTGEDLPS